MNYKLKDKCKCGKKLDESQVVLYAIFKACPHPKKKDK